MKFYYLEYRVIYSAVFTKKAFNSAEERNTFIVKNAITTKAAYINKVDYEINSPEKLVEILNYMLL